MERGVEHSGEASDQQDNTMHDTARQRHLQITAVRDVPDDRASPRATGTSNSVAAACRKCSRLLDGLRAQTKKNNKIPSPAQASSSKLDVAQQRKTSELTSCKRGFPTTVTSAQSAHEATKAPTAPAEAMTSSEKESPCARGSTRYWQQKQELRWKSAWGESKAGSTRRAIETESCSNRHIETHTLNMIIMRASTSSCTDEHASKRRKHTAL